FSHRCPRCTAWHLRIACDRRTSGLRSWFLGGQTTLWIHSWIAHHPRRGRWSRCRLLGGNPRRQTVPDAFDPAAVMTVVDQHPHNDPADQHYQRAVAAAHQKLTDAIVDTAQVRSPVSESW